MKKKSLTLMIAVVGIFFLFLPSVSAHEGENCTCNSVTGADKNKQVAALLKSDEFKTVKKDLKENGYQWKGVSGREVDYDPTLGYAIAIPVYPFDQTEEKYMLFGNGIFFDIVSKH